MARRIDRTVRRPPLPWEAARYSLEIHATRKEHPRDANSKSYRAAEGDADRLFRTALRGDLYRYDGIGDGGEVVDGAGSSINTSIIHIGGGLLRYSFGICSDTYITALSILGVGASGDLPTAVLLALG